MREAGEEAASVVRPVESDAASFGIDADGIKFEGGQIDFSGSGDFFVGGDGFVFKGAFGFGRAKTASVALADERAVVVASVGGRREAFDDDGAPESGLFFIDFGGTRFAGEDVGNEEGLSFVKSDPFAAFDESGDVEGDNFVFIVFRGRMHGEYGSKKRE